MSTEIKDRFLIMLNLVLQYKDSYADCTSGWFFSNSAPRNTCAVHVSSAFFIAGIEATDASDAFNKSGYRSI